MARAPIVVYSSPGFAATGLKDLIGIVKAELKLTSRNIGV